MKTQKWLHCDVIHKKFNNFYNWNQKIPGKLYMPNFMFLGYKTSEFGGEGEGAKYAKVLSVFNLKAHVR